MKRIGYLFFRGFTLFISIIPFRILYWSSDFYSIVMQYVVRYRLKTVTENLKNSFPEKNDAEIKRIVRRYYKNLCDISLETIKGYSLSTKRILSRYQCLNPEITHKYYKENKDIIIAMSHYANWEWGTQVASKFFMHRPVTFYKPLSNEYFDDYLRQCRMKQGMELYSVYKPKLLQRLNNESPKAYFLVSDQSPSRGKEKKAYWINFLNQDTACLRGIESYAKLLNLPVFYADVQRIKRGHYTIELEEICTYPENTRHGEITAKYMKKLEDIILKKPDDWLWSHKRWKLNKPDEMLTDTFPRKLN